MEHSLNASKEMSISEALGEVTSWVLSANGFLRGQCWNFLNHAWIGFKRANLQSPKVIPYL